MDKILNIINIKFSGMFALLYLILGITLKEPYHIFTIMFIVYLIDTIKHIHILLKGYKDE